MKFTDVKEKFLEFEKECSGNSFVKIDDFLSNLKHKYLNEKTIELEKKGILRDSAHNKARQSWKTFVGNCLERLVHFWVKRFCEEYEVSLVTDRQLKSKSLSEEYDLVRRMLEIHFNEYSLLPDADIVVYNYNKPNRKVKIFCILSVKNSFRERFTETPYWKLKLKDNKNTKHIKVFMITPDKDNEMSFIKSRGPRKARIVMEYELDGIYMAKERFDSSDKIKEIEQLFVDLKKLIKTS